MVQLNLTPSDPGKINLDALNKEIPGTVAIVLTKENRLVGVTQKGEIIAVVPPQAATPATPAASGLSAKEVDAKIAEVTKSLTDDFEKKLEKAIPKKKAAAKSAPKGSGSAEGKGADEGKNS